MQPIPTFTADELAEKLSPRASYDMVEWERKKKPADLFGKILDAEQPLSTFSKPVPNSAPMSDDRPVNEYFLLRYRGE